MPGAKRKVELQSWQWSLGLGVAQLKLTPTLSHAVTADAQCPDVPREEIRGADQS